MEFTMNEMPVATETPDGLVEYGNYEEMYPMSNEEFSLFNCIVADGIQKEKDLGVSALAFDTHEELLWNGTKSGHVTSYYGLQLQKYTSFQVHPTEDIRNLITIERGILALSQTSLRFQMRRGIPIFTYSSPSMLDMHSLMYNSSTGRILMGGLQEDLIEFDLTTKKEIRKDHLEGGTCAILRESSRFICSGDANTGKIHLRDPRTLSVRNVLDSHIGVLSDFDVHGHHLVTCGQTMRHGMLQPDRFLMVYDLRIMRAVNPIQVAIPPYQLRFLPAMSSRIVVLSSMGQVQLVDTAALSMPELSIFNISMPLEQCSTISMDISSSNQCLSFGDTSNSIHLYSSVAEPVFNPYARETEFAYPVEQLPPMDITDRTAIYSSVPRPHLPTPQSTYLSDMWPERFNKKVYRPTPEIDPEIQHSITVGGSLGYGRNAAKFRRNQVRYKNWKSKEHGDRNSREIQELQGSSPGIKLIPKAYRKIGIKLSKIGADDFDFDRYNRTGFCGLEANLPNSYCNAMVQIFYYTENLRLLLLNHTCSRENCICCELSFLFHMLDSNRGMPCHSGNFLRSMRTIPEAAALGLIFADQNSCWSSNVTRLIQSWNRFILHQMSTQIFEKISPEIEPDCLKMFKNLYGFCQEKVKICSKCKVPTSSSDLVLLCNLIYPETKDRVTFEEIACASLSPEQITPAWCEKCKKFMQTTQQRNLNTLPQILTINTGLDNQTDINFWNLQMNLLHQEIAPSETNEINETPEPSNTPIPPPNVKPCRYGQSCNRLDCKFWHHNARNGIKEKTIDIADKLAALKASWVPLTMKLKIKDGKVISSSDDSSEDTKTYHLSAVCCSIFDPLNEEAQNLVATINVGAYYHSRIASPVTQWYVFNDFSINTVTPLEAVTFNLQWKRPCIFFYTAESDSPCKELNFTNPITAEVFKEDKSLAQKGRKRITFNPLSPEEMPKSGDLVAIDAEFVTLNQEESEVRSDGKVSTIKAAHMSVARITCVRGSGPQEGEPFIDDYISTQEQVVDYVTKFSGIKPGDLDANFSSKHLTTLKSTYKKLRYLVDTGCTFIGHGLKNDFKVINIVVPVEQVIDTVYLFHLPHHRMVSLKFLAWYFLSQNIQGDTHDSIEDAVTALNLYKKYLELKEKDKFIESLNKLYEKGKECSWKVPENEL